MNSCHAFKRRVATNCGITAQFATITQQTSAAASQAESDAQSAIDQAKRELEDLQRNQEREEDQARTLTDMSFDQRTELDQKISNVTDRNSGLNALDAIQSSGIITADEALEVRRANSEITQEILREILKDKESAEEELQEYVKQREAMELIVAQKQEELKAVTELHEQLRHQAQEQLDNVRNLQRAIAGQ